MSRSLFWRPIPKEPEGNSLPSALMYAIEDRLSGGFAAEGLRLGEKEVINAEWLGWLDGLAYGGVDGAKELAEHVREHDEVEVWTDR